MNANEPGFITVKELAQKINKPEALVKMTVSDVLEADIENAKKRLAILERNEFGAWKLYKFSSSTMPTVFVKSKTMQTAVDLFRVGFSVESYKKHVVDNKDFKVEELNMEKFLEAAPFEFKLDDDVSF